MASNTTNIQPVSPIQMHPTISIPWENYKEVILGITIAFTVLSGICVLLRLYTRAWIVRSLWWDDAFVGLYLITTIASAVAICIASYNGLGQHLLVVMGRSQVRMYLMMFYLANAGYDSSTTFIKLSLLCQYLRIYEPGTATRRLCIVLMIVIGLWGSAFMFMSWFPCFPVHKFWDINTVGTCYGFGIAFDFDLYIIHNALNMVFDLMVLVMPAGLYFRKNTPLKTRLGIAGLLILGFLVTVFAAWRLVFLVQQAQNAEQSLDTTFYTPDPILLSVMEVSIASICASIPIFWPVLSRQLSRLFVVVTKEVKVSREDRYKDLGETSGSDTELAEPAGFGSQYNDSFIRDQIFPFREERSVGVETLVHSESGLASKIYNRGG